MYTNIINSKVNRTVNNSNDKKLEKNNKITINGIKKSKGNFQKEKYLTMLKGSETLVAVEDVISKLKKEAENARNCINAQSMLKEISWIISKAQSKHAKLSEEKVMEKKCKKAEEEKNKEKKKKINNELQIKKVLRKNEEQNDIYYSSKDSINQKEINKEIGTIIDESVDSINNDEDSLSMSSAAIDTMV